MKQYNDYSPKILEFFPVLSKGQSLRFQVSNTYFDRVMGKQVVPTSVSIRSIDRIYDPGHDKEIDIAYITGTRPLGPNHQRDEETILGEIAFTRGNFGMFEWDGNKAQEALAKYLFFSNSNGSNVGKPWYLEGTTQYRILGDEGASVKLKGEVLSDEARIKISAMTDAEIEQIMIAWFPQDHGKLTRDQQVLRLRTIAEKDPKRIMDAGNNAELALQAFVNTCLKAGLIRCNENNTKWLFKDGTLLTTVSGDETPYVAIRKFLTGEVGQKVRLVLEEEMVAAG